MDSANENGLPKIIAVVGTNASGKSALTVELALRFGGEIISADSRQVFRGLDLGSGKITKAEMKGVPHHLIDVCEPNDFFSMADFQRLAYAAADDIIARGKLPFLAGGTGLYVNSVLDGYLLSDIAPDLEYRNELEKLTTEQLYKMLTEKMPDLIIDKNNRNRVMRVLEKLHDGDSAVPQKCPRYSSVRLGVSWKREKLLERIDERLKRRMDEGMLAETENLLKNGATPEFLDGLGLEYRYLSRYVLGKSGSLDETLSELSLAIKRFARRQMTWFRRDKSIIWLDMEASPLEEAEAAVKAFLNGN
ncbi:MAG: tRNA (adenosine(37)-N6)-dimethylallyltransferase MiaA [Eubacteriales bacterium]|nr:tRNA (adenosine(37)-N6)-dimethylallyltransferase MiaA [Eubacteriales bacterium]MDD3881376.1 tRNA (adenosine(37)-N6)-dimethylallyltransferase MiaA [Eubacteriales bacterium]MDD4513063.1 tRNA (adenosine(37)-N6)-dimethylallyltransferase MiaA [Eubacteriales bacterium]